MPDQWDSIDLCELNRRVRAFTPRERDIWPLLAFDLTYRQIGDRLNIQEQTVHRHVSGIYNKLGVKGRLGAARLRWEWELQGRTG